jgi:hypothetical protein
MDSAKSATMLFFVFSCFRGKNQWRKLEIGLAHDPPQSVRQPRHIEVHEQTHAQSRRFQVAEHLRQMDRRQLFDRLDLKNQTSGNHHIQMLISEETTSIEHRNSLLSFEGQPRYSQLDADGAGIQTLEQTWTELAMDADATTDRSPHQVFDFIVQA